MTAPLDGEDRLDVLEARKAVNDAISEIEDEAPGPDVVRLLARATEILTRIVMRHRNG